MICLDASAVLALLNDEPGADVVAASLGGAIFCAVNLAEVAGKLVDVGADPEPVGGLLVSAGVAVVPLTAADSALVGALRAVAGGRDLSLGDRCCIATCARHDATALTADRRWVQIDLPVPVQLIR